MGLDSSAAERARRTAPELTIGGCLGVMPSRVDARLDPPVRSRRTPGPKGPFRPIALPAAQAKGAR